jgi:hypothetical protein
VVWPSRALSGAVLLATLAVGCFPSPRSSVPSGGAGGAGGAQSGLGGNVGATGSGGSGGTTGGAGADGGVVPTGLNLRAGGLTTVEGATPPPTGLRLLEQGFEGGQMSCGVATTLCVVGGLVP